MKVYMFNLNSIEGAQRFAGKAREVVAGADPKTPMYWAGVYVQGTKVQVAMPGKRAGA